MVSSYMKVANKDDAPRLLGWGGDDAFTHTLCVGPTRCGKTATFLKPLIFQIMLAKRRGKPVGLSVIEPKGDVARMVKEMAEDMGLKDELVYIDPLYPDETQKINVMKGDNDSVAEATVTVLKSLFGKQDAFFATVQELSTRKTTLLLKELFEDNIDITDVLSNLRDVNLLQQNVNLLRQRKGNTELVQFFDNELLGSGPIAEKYRQFIIGLRAQLENITSNEDLRKIVTGKSDIDLDEHYEKGGILAVNTALGKLGKAGDAFGMFMAMHLQLATFRRRGTEKTRVPHYLIIDEFSRYINPDIERFLSISAEYRVALIAAVQSLGQLELESGTLSPQAMKKAILTSTRNKIVFGGLSAADAKEMSLEMGSDMVRKRTKTYDGGILENFLPKSYKDEEVEKERYQFTQLMDGLPRFHYIHKLLQNGTPQEPGVALGEFVPRNWKDQLETENLQGEPKKPPIWDWRNRAVYEVKRMRAEEAAARQKKLDELLNDDFFDEKPASEPEALENQMEIRKPANSMVQINIHKEQEPVLEVVPHVVPIVVDSLHEKLEKAPIKEPVATTGFEIDWEETEEPIQMKKEVRIPQKENDEELLSFIITEPVEKESIKLKHEDKPVIQQPANPIHSFNDEPKEESSSDDDGFW